MKNKTIEKLRTKAIHALGGVMPNDVFDKPLGEIKEYTKFPHGWVGCPACHLYINWVHDDRWAIKRWNTRVMPELESYFKRWEAEKEL